MLGPISSADDFVTDCFPNGEDFVLPVAVAVELEATASALFILEAFAEAEEDALSSVALVDDLPLGGAAIFFEDVISAVAAALDALPAATSPDDF